jgi:hypothetical protein
MVGPEWGPPSSQAFHGLVRASKDRACRTLAANGRFASASLWERPTSFWGQSAHEICNRPKANQHMKIEGGD